MFELFKKQPRPAYFYHPDFEPNCDDFAFSGANRIKGYTPSILNWTFDQIEFHITHISVATKDKKQLAIQFLKMLRVYSKATDGIDVYSTLVLQLYICEMLVSVLLLSFNIEVPKGHGYQFDLANNFDIKNAYLKTKTNGLSIKLHDLFYATPFQSKFQMPTFEEYFSFIPEVRKEYSAISQVSRTVAVGLDDYRGTGTHVAPGIYHSANLNRGVDDLRNQYQTAPRNNILFPELISEYTVAGRFSSKCVTAFPKCDDFISVTSDVNGDAYALGFGGSPVQKQRDVEIRFYLIFILGSIARYRPIVWDQLAISDPAWYFLVRRFSEHNQILFPLQILRYLSGRGYYFSEPAKFG